MKFRVTKSSRGKLGRDWKRTFKLQIRTWFIWGTFKTFDNRRELAEVINILKPIDIQYKLQ